MSIAHYLKFLFVGHESLNRSCSILVPFLIGGISDYQAPVVQTLDSAIHWINHYPADKY